MSPGFDKHRPAGVIDPTEWFPERDGSFSEWMRKRNAIPEPDEPEFADDDPYTTYYVGVDLAKLSDYTAICIDQANEQNGEVQHNIRWTRRLPRGTRYMKVAAALKKIDAQLTKDGASAAYILDAGGVGEGVSEIVEKALGYAEIYKVYIHGGQNTTWDGHDLHVSKAELVSELIKCFERGTVRLPSRSRELANVLDELENFSLHLSEAGREHYSANAGKNDDLVLALCMAVFVANGQGAHDIHIW